MTDHDMTIEDFAVVFHRMMQSTGALDRELGLLVEMMQRAAAQGDADAVNKRIANANLAKAMELVGRACDALTDEMMKVRDQRVMVQ